jgi:sugar phosphate permease
MTVYAQWFKGRSMRVYRLLVAIGGSVACRCGTPAFITQVFDWRTVFVFIGVLIALTAVTWLVADSPDKKGFSSVAEPGAVRATSAGIWRGLAALCTEKYFWSLAPWYFMRTGVLFSFAGLWAGPYLMDVHKLSKLATGNLLSIVPIAIIVGSPFLGYLSDKVFASRKVILVGSSILHCACWVVLLLYLETVPVGWLCVVLFLMGIGSGSPGSVGFANVKEIFPSSMAGTAIGAANLFAFLGGVSFSLIGYVLDLSGRVAGAHPPAAYRTASGSSSQQASWRW